MGLDFSSVRESTRGGELEKLLVRGDMVTFQSVEGMTQLERALRYALAHDHLETLSTEARHTLMSFVQGHGGSMEVQVCSCFSQLLSSFKYRHVVYLKC
jgi:hypothetical protein